MYGKSSDFQIDNSVINYPTGMSAYHFHNNYEVFLMKRGNRRYYIYDEYIDLHDFTILIIKPNIPHKAVKTVDLPYTRTMICFQKRFLSPFHEYLENTILKNQNDCALFFTPSEKEFLNIYNMFFEKDNNNAFVQLPLNQCRLFRFICLLEKTAVKRITVSEKDNASKRMFEIAMYIQENISEPLKIKDLASHFSTTPSAISAFVKRYTCTSLKAYILGLKFDYSVRLLLKTNLSVCEIAYRCGFESSNYFGDFFRKRSGFSPLDYRRMLKQ